MARRRFKLPESDIQGGVMGLLNALHIPAWRTNSRTVMLPGKGGSMRPVFMGKLGGSDVEALVPLRLRAADGKERKIAWAWYIECKRPLGPMGGTGGSDQNKDQVEFQRIVEAAGAKYVLVRGVEELQMALRANGFPC